MAAMESRFTAPVPECEARYGKILPCLQLRIEGKALMQMIGATQNFEGKAEFSEIGNVAKI